MRFCNAIRGLSIAAAISLFAATGCGGVETEGENSVYAAAQVGDVGAIREALDYDFEVNTPDADGMTLLHHAAVANQVDVVEMLINEFGASITAKDNQGRTPLDVARDRGSQDAFVVLSQEGG